MKAKRPRAWNSTLPSPTKTLSRSSTGLKKTGATKAKKGKRLAKARQSPHTRAWVKAVLARDGHQCTARIIDFATQAILLNTFGVGPGPFPGWRCEATEDLHVHHLRYRPGAERLEDGVALCKPHHEYIESICFPHRRRA